LVIGKENSGVLVNSPASQAKKMHMLGQLAFGIIHDIRNSLQILRASSIMIRKQTSDEILTRNIDAIDAVIENTSQMIERVLSFSNKSVNRPGFIGGVFV
jgi:signal transduction histidine kinase